MSRVFWLGAHKVLKQTELTALRTLGREVFNPPYISPVYDQSMDRRIDWDQPTSLPKEIFEELMRYDFFYKSVTERISRILNEYFDFVIVTINADWLSAFLKAYSGPIIYRIYGQHFSLSQKMVEIGIWRDLIERPHFAIVPFCQETIECEHGWFQDLCTHVVPYQIPDDTFAHSKSWAAENTVEEIATSIPNIQNSYFEAEYRKFTAEFPHRLFKIYGPQRAVVPDSRIVGALPRDVLLDRFKLSRGFFYNYSDAVCYLPPIEMMEVGGPVLYRPGSLLSRMYEKASPGLTLDQADAEQKIKLLLRKDPIFASEVIASQESVRRRYDRALVKPAFKAAFSELLQAPGKGVASSKICLETKQFAKKNIYIFLHIDGLFYERGGRAYATEGIPRVVDALVEALTSFGDSEIIVTTTSKSEPIIHDFFFEPVRSGRLRLICVDGESSGPNSDIFLTNRLRLISTLNEDNVVGSVFVPHYYLFPEALLLKCELILYLPDYFPHLMPNVIFDASAEKDAENKRVGIALAQKARSVLTSSKYTASYLPEAGFVGPGEQKLSVAPLPMLGSRSASKLTDEEQYLLQSKLFGRRFIFYPTANRPNKQLAFLMRIVSLFRMTNPDVALVLTSSLGFVPAVAEAFHNYGLDEHVVFLPNSDEPTLRWLYENSMALCLTSTLEGNFPPQIFEALTYQAPVVATRLAPILDALGERANDLLLCSPLDLDAFVEALEAAARQRHAVLERQSHVLAHLRERTSLHSFYDCVGPLLELADISSPSSSKTREL